MDEIHTWSSLRKISGEKVVRNSITWRQFPFERKTACSVVSGCRSDVASDLFSDLSLS